MRNIAGNPLWELWNEMKQRSAGIGRGNGTGELPASTWYLGFTRIKSKFWPFQLPEAGAEYSLP